MNLFQNPEFIRYARERLRHKWIILGIAVVVSLAVILSVWGLATVNSSNINSDTMEDMGMAVFITLLVFTFIIGYIINSIVCIFAISTEKNHKTYDFQLMTKLTPTELMIGKLFGAPIVGYILMGIFAFFSVVMLPLWGGVSFETVIVSYIILFVSSILLNSIGLLISSFLKNRLWIFMLVGGYLFLQVIGIFIAYATQSFGGVSNRLADSGISVLNPITTISNTFSNTPSLTNIFGIGAPSFITQILFYIFVTFMILFAIKHRIKNTYNPFTRYHVIILVFILQLLILGFLWPPIFSTLAGQGGVYSGLEYTTNRIDYLGTFATFLSINLALLLILGIANIKSKEDLNIWFRQKSQGFREKMGHFFDSKSLPNFTMIGLSIFAVSIFSLSYLVFGFSSIIENNSQLFFSLAALFILFIVRELGYFAYMRLTKLGKNLGYAFLFLGIFYLIGSIIVTIFADGDINALLLSIFPLLPFLMYEELASKSFMITPLIYIVFVETVIIYILFILQLKKAKQKSLELEQK